MMTRLQKQDIEKIEREHPNVVFEKNLEQDINNVLFDTQVGTINDRPFFYTTYHGSAYLHVWDNDITVDEVPLRNIDPILGAKEDILTFNQNKDRSMFEHLLNNLSAEIPKETLISYKLSKEAEYFRVPTSKQMIPFFVDTFPEFKPIKRAGYWNNCPEIFFRYENFHFLVNWLNLQNLAALTIMIYPDNDKLMHSNHVIMGIGEIHGNKEVDIITSFVNTIYDSKWGSQNAYYSTEEGIKEAEEELRFDKNIITSEAYEKFASDAIKYYDKIWKEVRRRT